MNREEVNALLDTMETMVRNERKRADTVLDELRMAIRAIPAGAAGRDGEDGHPGPAGIAGPKGEPGETVVGPAGAKGDRGERGESIVGPPGQQGERGIDGKTPDVEPIIAAILRQIPPPQHGRDGKDGESIVGPPGPPGPVGFDGKDGARGIDGHTPEIDPIIAAVLKRIPAPQNGRDGKDGESIRGDKGEPGKDADRDLIREFVSTEVARLVATIPIPKDGRDGRDGIAKDGRDGTNGRDASEIEIIQKVDESRKYPKGTLGICAAGLCRSTGESWVPLVPIVVDVKEEKAGRVITRKNVWSDGRETVCLQYKTEEIIWREIYRAGTEYEKGDCVTRDGSSWHCQVEKTTAEPGKSPDWKLIVKRGQDGKDGKDIKGERGPQGTPGQDMRYK